MTAILSQPQCVNDDEFESHATFRRWEVIENVNIIDGYNRCVCHVQYRTVYIFSNIHYVASILSEAMEIAFTKHLTLECDGIGITNDILSFLCRIELNFDWYVFFYRSFHLTFITVQG